MYIIVYSGPGQPGTGNWLGEREEKGEEGEGEGEGCVMRDRCRYVNYTDVDLFID